MCPNFGTPKIINFLFRTNGKFIIFLGVPILKHITVSQSFCNSALKVFFCSKIITKMWINLRSGAF